MSCESAAMSALLSVPLIWHLRVGLAGLLDGWVPGESFGPKRRAADFPGVVAQRGGGALDRAGQFVRGEPLAQVGHQVLVRCRLGQFDDGAGNVTEVLVREAGHAAGLDGGVFVQGGLDLGRVDVRSSDEDHVREPGR